MTKEDNIRAILETHFTGFKEEIIESAVKMIMDVTEVRHGRWKCVSVGRYACSICGCEPWYSGSINTINHCPNCGALMELKNLTDEVEE